MPDNNHVHQEGSSRRTFLKTASAIAGGAVLGANARIARSAHVAGSDEIKIALVGCGGRGTGAAGQALATKGKITLWAVADAFDSCLQRGLNSIQEQVKRGQRDGDPLFKDATIDVPRERQFVGLDAYKHAINSGADVILLATPPHFRPMQFEAAVKAGKHIFAEKPLATDPAGVRRFMAANEEAKKKGIMVAIGLQRRHDPRYVETVKKVENGALGDVLFMRVYWNSGGLWVRPRAQFASENGHDPSEMEYQINNWYYFTWLSGDHIVEQHIHNLDVGNWLRGDKHPISAQGMGGRQVRTGKEYGQIFDHHFIEYTYDDGTKMYSQCRQQDNTAGEVREHAHGTKGTLDIDDGGGPIIKTAQFGSPTKGWRSVKKDGTWRMPEPKLDNHHQEQLDLYAALRDGRTYNEGDYGAQSTMTAILGRMATYSGQIIKWDDALHKGIEMSPSAYEFSATPPVLPDSNGYYPVPMPGKTQVLNG
jgi:myo-inositol 2-dehydrogenase/D-chiro-inositol 1-dehydrogenase